MQKLSGLNQSKDGNLKTRDALRLHLTSRNAEAAYSSMDIWIDKDYFKTFKVQFYALNGTLLKTTFYRHYERILNGTRPTEAIIIDGMNHDKITIIKNTDFKFISVPEAWMQRDYLPNFKPEYGL
ncbi:outer membrane lipoprotein-sorting protein [Pantoea rodasii]|uniref:outer membrane lipoprotein-sorting protein n=1 Tax=Pantoea rodasii TaxID=1076549 RepID=UPI0024529CDC|nr:outer membrane lipoprotein-sorting protein [Pantoea rodasii]